MDFVGVVGGEREEGAAVGGGHGVDGGGLADQVAGDLLGAVAGGLGTDRLECFGGFRGGEGADFGTCAGRIDMDAKALWGGTHEEIEGDGLGHGAAAGVAGADKEDSDLIRMRGGIFACGVGRAGGHAWQHTGRRGLMLVMGTRDREGAMGYRT